MADAAPNTFNIAEFIGKVGSSDYLNADYRMVWFHQSYGERGSVVTEMLRYTTYAEAGNAACAVFKAAVTIYDEHNVAFVYTGHGSETYGDFPEYMEKAETKAISRALEHAGFGTMNAQAMAGTLPPPNSRARSAYPSGSGSQSRREGRPDDDEQARNRAIFEKRKAEAAAAGNCQGPLPASSSAAMKSR